LPCASAPLAENKIPIVKARTGGVTRFLKLPMMEQTQTWADLRGLSVGDVMYVMFRNGIVGCWIDARRWIGKEESGGVKCDATGVSAPSSDAALSLGWCRASRIEACLMDADRMEIAISMPHRRTALPGESSWLWLQLVT
jgi:hypothetical protein